MAGAPSRGVWEQLDGLLRSGASGQLGDAELLGRFVSGRRDTDAENAFAALVERHGPMVLGVCRRVLRDRHEAEDAFQATFLVLARRAGAIARRDQLASWLHGVASRTALDARARGERRRARERKAAATAVRQIPPDDDPEHAELRAILDEELARLPDPYRGPVILCELDGLSRQAAARRLGIPEGTLSSRLARAKELLRHRLTRRGLAPSAVAIGALAHEARAVLLPPSLAGSTIRSAARVAAGASLAEAASASVVTLTQGALSAMYLAKIKGLALGLAAAAVVTTGVGVLAQPPGAGSRRGPGAPADRLSAVEKKLDRILEALGSRQGDATGEGADTGGALARAPAVEKPAAPKHAEARPGAAPQVLQGTIEPPPVSKEMMRLMQWQAARQQLQGKLDSPPIEARVANLERRLNDLERRLGAMERRLDQPSAFPGPPEAGAAGTARDPFSTTPEPAPAGGAAGRGAPRLEDRPAPQGNPN